MTKKMIGPDKMFADLSKMQRDWCVSKYGFMASVTVLSIVKPNYKKKTIKFIVNINFEEKVQKNTYNFIHPIGVDTKIGKFHI